VGPSDFPEPSASPITEVSPSVANALLACQLRVAFDRDGSMRSWRRPTTFTALGQAAHAVVELAARRGDWPTDADAARARLAELWDQEIAAQADRLTKCWAPAHPPPPTDWPAYALTRVRTIKRATSLACAPRSPKRQHIDGTGIEVEMRDPGTMLVGRADRVEVDDGAIRVVDLKTGLRQAEPTDQQRRQLLLYALLVHRTTGMWPASIAVEDASGHRYEEPCDPAEAEAAAGRVQAAVALFNERVTRGRRLPDAAPDADTCRWCPYRVVCGPYWHALRSGWDHRAAAGAITHSGTGGGDGHFNVVIAIKSPNDRAGEELHLASVPGPPQPSNTHIAAVDWAPGGGRGQARARWSTLVRTW
jgi:CRISPR/Cas system-associated exonuclease Cas4 (RecB family)